MSVDLSIEHRNEVLRHALAESSDLIYDLLIIGGGITGAGVARDAASRGLRVLLVEAEDFAGGTSSRSSKLIHGGIRYLENLELGLVFEALTERRRLFEMAPHLVHHLRFMLPVYRGDRVGYLKLWAGMWLYDALALFEPPQMHEALNPAATLARLPQLRGQDLIGSFVYSDAYMDDDRLVFETLRSARTWGADVVNYVKVDAGQYKNNSWEIQAVDQLSQQPLRFFAKHIVSAVGPWTDILGHSLSKNWTPLMRPSKGVHLTLPVNRITLPTAMVLATGADRRILFAIPRHDMLILGTTDTDFQGDPREVRTERADIDYILKVTNTYFPQAQLKINDVINTYAGVRPLVHDGSAHESDTSREHRIWSPLPQATFVAGGKYTTYRSMAEEIVDHALEFFTVGQRVQHKTGQSLAPLNPQCSVESYRYAHTQIDSWASELGMKHNVVRTCVQRHGMEAQAILSLWQKYRHHSLWAAEARHAVRTTMCINLLNFMLRRTPLALGALDHGESDLVEVARAMQDELGWSDQQLAEELSSYRSWVKTHTFWRNPELAMD